MKIQPDYRPRRSCLYMPGANQRALEKAKSLPADMLILDLEDAVAPESKASAREAVAAAVSAREYGAREVVVRINAMDSAWGRTDLEMAVQSGADGILLPKVAEAGQIVELEQLVTAAGASSSLRLWAMIETPLAILNIRDIAASAGESRLSGLVLGLNDLAKEMGAELRPGRVAFQSAMTQTLLAARAFGLSAIDAVFNDIGNEEGFTAECLQAREMGFDGKSLIHPSQLETANRVFSPDPEAVRHARSVIEAFARPENQGRGVIKVEGRMTELLHLQQAERLVAIDEAISALQR